MRRRITTTALLASTLIGCATVRTVDRPDAFIASKHPKELWLTRVDGKELLLVQPRIEGNEVVGWARGRVEEQVRVPLSETEYVAARQLSSTRTALAVGLGVVAGGLFLHAVTRGAGGIPGCGNPFPNSPADCANY
jgi:hypothetical protein